MRQFPPDATLDRLEEEGRLTARHVEAIAATIARFIWKTAHAPARTVPSAIRNRSGNRWRKIFCKSRPGSTKAADRQQLDALQHWSEAEHARLAPLMAARKRDGFIRECHGDLHLGNLAWVDDQLLVFDCLEFNPELRWIDILSEIAFCTMDLMQRGHTDWAWLLLNTWLEKTGDYEGLALLRYYAVFGTGARQSRCAARRTNQRPGPRHCACRGARHAGTGHGADAPPALAARHHTRPVRFGKTTVTQTLMQTPGAIRVRSDVERNVWPGSMPWLAAARVSDRPSMQPTLLVELIAI